MQEGSESIVQMWLKTSTATSEPWVCFSGPVDFIAGLCIHRLEEVCVLLQGIKKVVGRTVTHSWLHVAV